MLTTQQNSVLAIDFIVEAGMHFLDGIVPRNELRERAKALVSCPKDLAAVRLREYFRWLDGVFECLPSDDDQRVLNLLFRRLSGQFSDNFLLCVEVPEDSITRRMIIKYSMDQQMPPSVPRGTKRTVIRPEVQDLGFAHSQHFEVQVPQGLEIVGMQMKETDMDGTLVTKVHANAEGSRTVAHCSIAPSHRYSQGTLTVRVEPSAQGIFTYAWSAVIVVFVAVVFGLITRCFDELILSTPQSAVPSSAASIILVGPALLLSWMSRQPEHELSVRTLRPLRMMLILCAMSLVVLAGLAAVRLTAVMWNVGWGLSVAAALLALIWLILFSINQPLPGFLRRMIYTGLKR